MKRAQPDTESAIVDDHDEEEDQENVDQNHSNSTSLVLKKPKISSSFSTDLVPTDKKPTQVLSAPTMQLTGHQGAVHSCKFSPNGKFLASASFDHQILLWQVGGECVNWGVLLGHKNSIMDLQWSYDSNYVYSGSCDKTTAVWDVEYEKRIRKLVGHSMVVNCCSSVRRGPPLVVTASDDGSVKIWDSRVKYAQGTLNNRYPVTSVCFNDDATQIIAGSIDNLVKVWDVRDQSVTLTLAGHSDTVTGVSLSPDGSFILSNAMDNTLRVWDIRPFVPKERCLKVFTGHQHDFEKNLLRCAWSPNGRYITAGSADRNVYIWDANSRKVLYKLPGHAGTVNEVVFHPTHSLIASCSSDKTIYLGELEL